MSSVNVSATYIDDIIGVCVTARKGVGSTRSPAHFTLLVDTSGSMDGPRIAEVKRTIHRLIDEMESIDLLSVITYSSEATILLNTVKMSEDRALFHTATDTLTAMGGTNLQSAFMAIPSLTTPPGSVFLLTDGHVNIGLMRSSELISIAGSILPSDTPLHTLGYGYDHNQPMLRDMSLRTHASYTYADSDEIIPLIIGNILGGLTTEVGRGTHLILPPGYKSLELNYKEGEPYVSIGRLIDEKSHWILLQGSPLPTEIEFRWKDHLNHVELIVPVPSDQPLILKEQVLRAITAKTLSEVTDYMAVSHMEVAKVRLEELKAQLDGSAVASRPLIIQLRAQVDGMLEDIRIAGSAPPPAMLSRMLSTGASTTAYAGNQAGVLSGPPSALRSMTGNVFSSPRQTAVMRNLSQPTSYTSEESP